jgi:hypothetical protein
MFGADLFADQDHMVEKLLEIMRPLLESKPKLSPVEARMTILRSYLVWTGMFTEAQIDANPVCLVAYHPAEDSYLSNLIDDHLDHYLDFDIERTGLSFLEYLQLPRHRLIMVRDAAEKMKKRRNKAQSDAVEKAEADLRGLREGNQHGH